MANWEALRNRGVACALGLTLAIGVGGATASATPIHITMTGTLSNGGASFPWGMASNTIPASSFYSIDGDSFTARFTFDTALGTISSAAGTTTLSGPASIASGDILVAGHDFVVPACNISPCPSSYTTLAQYSRSANSIKVLFYEDPSASSGLVLQAAALGSWGSNLTDAIPTQPVLNQGIDIILQPPDSYYNLAAFATVDTVSVSVPEPSAWAFMLMGVFGVGAALRSHRRAVAA
jgi:hypothetical protein